jgi:hypothetical protein
VRERLVQLARKLQERPWNRPGTDKTWVLQAMWQQRLFMREVRQATRVADGSELRSKELSDRPKDREFLRHFESRAGEEDDA